MLKIFSVNDVIKTKINMQIEYGSRNKWNLSTDIPALMKAVNSQRRRCLNSPESTDAGPRTTRLQVSVSVCVTMGCVF